MIELLNIWFISLYMIRFFFTHKQEFSKSRPHVWCFPPGLIRYVNPSVCFTETSDWTGLHLCVCVLLFLNLCIIYFEMWNKKYNINKVNLNVTSCCSISHFLHFVGGDVGIGPYIEKLYVHQYVCFVPKMATTTSPLSISMDPLDMK